MIKGLYKKYVKIYISICDKDINDIFSMKIFIFNIYYKNILL